MGGPMISGIGLSGSDREESESNRLWVSREAVVSKSECQTISFYALENGIQKWFTNYLWFTYTLTRSTLTVGEVEEEHYTSRFILPNVQADMHIQCSLGLNS